MVDAIEGGQFSLRDASHCVERSDLAHLGFGQLALVISLAARHSMPAFTQHVSHVVCVSPEEEVVGPHTCAYVAYVTNKKTVGNGAVVNLPRNAMRPKEVFAISYRPVTLTVSVADPFPAPVGDDNVFPETPRNWTRGGCGASTRSATKSSVASPHFVRRCKKFRTALLTRSRNARLLWHHGPFVVSCSGRILWRVPRYRGFRLSLYFSIPTPNRGTA